MQPSGQRQPPSPLLPWHGARLDGQGKLVAWYRPDRNLGYDHVLRLGWRFMERRIQVDRRAGVRVHLAWAVFDEHTLQGVYWQHNPAFLYASFVDSLIAWYPYSGDRRAVSVVRDMLDYQLRRGTTPAGWAWARVPFATSCGGERRYGGCLAGRPAGFRSGVEPDKVGLLGLGYLRFYELTGERRYLDAARDAATALASHVRPGDAAHTPWPFRVDGRTGATIDGARYGGAVVAPVELLDELIRLRAGDTGTFRRARNLAWHWILGGPLNRASAAWNRWGPFYEDGRYNVRNRNQMIPTLTVRYLLSRPDPNALDPDWREDSRALLESVRREFGRGPFWGAWGIDEQRAPGHAGCCSRVGLGSDSSRWAAAEALLFARTGDGAARERAVRALSYATYFARSDGRVSCCGVRRANEYWFSDGYADYLRSFNWALAAIPELAPRGQAHLLGSTSVVQSVAYGRRGVVYRTFDRAGEEVLRLPYRPARVVVGTHSVPLRGDDTAEGYRARSVGGGDYVVRVRHLSSKRVRIEG